MKPTAMGIQVARVLWIVYAFVAFIAFLFNIPAMLEKAGSVCSEVCEWYWLTHEAAAVLEQARIPISTYVISTAIPLFVTSIVFWIVGLLLFSRRSDQWFGLMIAYLLVNFGAIGPSAAFLSANPDTFVFAVLGSRPAYIFLQVLLLTFPNGRFQPRWTVALIGLMFVNIFFWTTDDPRLSIDNWPPGLLQVWLLIVFGTPLLTQFYRYARYYNRIERLQTKWLIVGVGLGLMPVTVIALALLIIPPSLGTQVFSVLVGAWFVSLLYLPVPIAVGVAILRYRLFDIDIIIRRTLIYTVLTGILAAIYFGGIILTQQLFRAATGETSDIGIVVSTLLIAALFAPLRRRVQDMIDRRLYRRKYDVEQTLADFQKNLREDVDIETLKANLVNVVSDTMQPTKIALWVKEPTSPQSKG
jgi:hypothetical protein